MTVPAKAEELPDSCVRCGGALPYLPKMIPDGEVCDPCYDEFQQARFGGPELRKRLLYCPACERYIDPAIERISMVSELGKGTRIRHGMTPDSLRDHPFAGYQWGNFKTLPERVNAD